MTQRLSELTADAWLGAQLGCPAFHLVGLPAASVPSLLDALPPGPSFVDAKVPADQVERANELVECGFRVVDVNVTLDRDRSPLPGAVPSSVGFAEAREADDVAALAATALTTSRFHLDPAIPGPTASALKATWARNFFTGQRGAWMVVAREEEQPTGFLQLLDRPDELVIDLIAVEPSRQGSGVGRSMFAFALACCGSAPKVVVGTQAANTRSLRFYESLGFRVAATTFVLHRHGQI